MLRVVRFYSSNLTSLRWLVLRNNFIASLDLSEIEAGQGDFLASSIFLSFDLCRSWIKLPILRLRIFPQSAAGLLIHLVGMRRNAQKMTKALVMARRLVIILPMSQVLMSAAWTLVRKSGSGKYYRFLEFLGVFGQLMFFVISSYHIFISISA